MGRSIGAEKGAKQEDNILSVVNLSGLARDGMEMARWLMVGPLGEAPRGAGDDEAHVATAICLCVSGIVWALQRQMESSHTVKYTRVPRIYSWMCPAMWTWGQRTYTARKD